MRKLIFSSRLTSLLLFLGTHSVFAQVTGTINYSLLGTPTASNPIPFVATVSDIYDTGWTGAFAITPTGIDAKSLPVTGFSPPVYGQNMISFDITPVCFLCILSGINFNLEVFALAGEFAYQVFVGATPISPISPTPIPFGPSTVSPLFTPVSITGPTQISIAFSAWDAITNTRFDINNLNVELSYNPVCIPEVSVGKLVAPLLASVFLFAFLRRRLMSRIAFSDKSSV